MDIGLMLWFTVTTCRDVETTRVSVVRVRGVQKSYDGSRVDCLI